MIAGQPPDERPEEIVSRDRERVDRIKQALSEADLDAVVCTLPANVLLLTGYWPVVGTSVAMALRDGAILLVAPEDERDLAAVGWADDVVLFHPASLDDMATAAENLRTPLRSLANRHGFRSGRLACESGTSFEPSSYAALHLYGHALNRILTDSFAGATIVPGDDLLARLKAVKTPDEVARLRSACRAVGEAFRLGAAAVRPGVAEVAAALFAAPLAAAGLADDDTRAGGFAFCMSGPNAADAGAAYARSRRRVIQTDELVLVHCNSYENGFWTDVTRTFCTGKPDQRQQQLFDAVFAARSAAFETIRPGVRAAAVDAAARDVLRGRGMGAEFTHATGHGVGFAAIDAGALPRLHPKSPDVLQSGMIFNVEPAVYLPGYGGLRHCDVVAVTPTGMELLTTFQTHPTDVIVSS